MEEGAEKHQRTGRAWPEERHVEAEGPAGATWASTPSETGALRWQAITQRLRRGFQQTPVLPAPAPLTHTLEPYTAVYVSAAISVIADYTHNCLTQVCQTCVNPRLGSLTFGLKDDCSERWLLFLTNCVLWRKWSLLFFFFCFMDRICL